MLASEVIARLAELIRLYGDNICEVPDYLLQHKDFVTVKSIDAYDSDGKDSIDTGKASNFTIWI